MEGLATILARIEAEILLDCLGHDSQITRLNGTILQLPGGSTLDITPGCSGLKQMVQYGMVLLFLPGGPGRKVIFFLCGALILWLVNEIRLGGLLLVLHFNPDSWRFYHNVVLRPLLYVTLFVLWKMYDRRIRATL